MNCAAARKALVLFLDGELEKSHAPSLEKHLSSCRACLREFLLLKNTRALFQKTSWENAAALSTRGLEERVLKRVAELLEAGELPEKTRTRESALRYFAFRLALPLGAVLLLLSALFFRQHNAAQALENYLAGDLHSLTSSFYTDLTASR